MRLFYKAILYDDLSSEDKAALRDETCCEICGTWDDLRVDHDHFTGFVRGILCNSHNVMIRQDNAVRAPADMLPYIADYLETTVSALEVLSAWGDTGDQSERIDKYHRERVAKEVARLKACEGRSESLKEIRELAEAQLKDGWWPSPEIFWGQNDGRRMTVQMLNRGIIEAWGQY